MSGYDELSDSLEISDTMDLRQLGECMDCDPAGGEVRTMRRLLVDLRDETGVRKVEDVDEVTWSRLQDECADDGDDS